MIGEKYVRDRWFREGRPQDEGRLLSEGLTVETARDHYDIACIVSSVGEVREQRQRFGVYTLVCRNPYLDESGSVRSIYRQHGVECPGESDLLAEVGDSPIVFYVGFSSNVVDRLYQHIDGSAGTVTEAYPPIRLRGVEWYREESDAKSRERELAAELREQHPAAYIGGGQ